MSRYTLYVYHKEKFKEFYEENSSKYRIVSLSSFLNISSQFEEDNFTNEKLLVDITTMLKLVLVRADIIMYYEVVINHLYQEGDVDIVVEHDYVDTALEIFPEYFLTKEYLTNREDGTNEENINEEKTIKLKNITVYNNNDFDKFINSKKEEGIKVISITKIIKKINMVDYLIDQSILNNDEKYMVDITSMVKTINLRSDLLMSFEIILNELSMRDNIEFAIDDESKDLCKQLFKYSFQEYLKVTAIDNDKIEEYGKKIVDMSTKDIDKLMQKVDKELFGHDDFKEDFKRQIKRYRILNKMKEVPVFSVFLCGDSGIGKTEVARILHRELYPNSKEIKINFGNYSERGSLWSLIGSPKGYYGSEKGGELTNKILNSDSKIILIDEFEKADKSIYNFFYELLEDGKFTDLDENEIDLNGYVIIFTSNLNESNYRNVISAPLFSRFSMRYEFMPLTNNDKKEFINYRTEQLINKYNETFDNKFDNTKKNSLLNINVSDLNNLRDINIRLTNEFINLVDGNDSNK